MVSHNVLVFLRRSPEALGAVLTAMRIVFSMNGNDVSLKARRISRAVVAILTLIHPALPWTLTRRPTSLLYRRAPRRQLRRPYSPLWGAFFYGRGLRLGWRRRRR